MAITLYDATVPVFLQGLDAMRVCLDKGLEHANAQGRSPDQLVDARLAEDMYPFYRQVMRGKQYSADALRDVRNGAWTPGPTERIDFPGLQSLIVSATEELRGWTPAAVNALENVEVVFDTGRRPRTEFTGAAYLLNFILPNFNFHVVTAYDILRMKGVPVGKRDWLGELRTRL